jgi:hypothetical protein
MLEVWDLNPSADAGSGDPNGKPVVRNPRFQMPDA